MFRLKTTMLIAAMLAAAALAGCSGNNVQQTAETATDSQASLTAGRQGAG